jgi:ABC-type glycerol-3-phosphate transport system substrate-binding protein
MMGTHDEPGIDIAARHTRRRFLARSLSTGAAVGSLPALLAACGGGTSAGTTTSAGRFTYQASGSTKLTGKLTLWEWSPGKPIFQKLIPEFNKRFPNVKVTRREFGYDDVHDKLGVAFQARTGAPDVSWVEEIYLGRYQALGGLADLRDVIAPYKAQLPDYMLQIATGRDGGIYGWPNDLGPTGLWYNAAVFKQAGASVPKTWDDYLQLGRELKGRGTALLPIAESPKNELPILFMLTEQNGASYFDADGKPTIDSPKVIEILRLLRTVIDEGLSANIDVFNEVPNFTKAWKQGKLATLIEGGWMATYWSGYLGTPAGKDTGVRLAPCPTIEPGGATAGNHGGSYLVVTQQSHAQDAAKAFVRFAAGVKASEDVQRDNGLVPAFGPTLDDAAFNDKPQPVYGGQMVWKTISELSAQVPASMHLPAAYQETETALAQNWPAFYHGQAPEAWAKMMQGKAEKIAAAYKG